MIFISPFKGIVNALVSSHIVKAGMVPHSPEFLVFLKCGSRATLLVDNQKYQSFFVVAKKDHYIMFENEGSKLKTSRMFFVHSYSCYERLVNENFIAKNLLSLRTEST